MKYDDNLKIFYSSLINDNRYFSGFGTRSLGDGRKIDNLINFLKNNRVDFRKIVILNQIHSVNTKIFTSHTTELIEKIEDTDGVVTTEDRVVLRVVTADCLPVIYVEKNKGIIGISHIGWRGSIKKMVEKMIERMIELGGDLKQIKIAIGPGIGQCCYNIDQDRYYQFKEEFDGYSDKIFRWYKGSWYLNLTLLNYLFLVDIGVKKSNIDFYPFCTRCDKKRFFSYRRDKKEEYGEMFSLVIRS